VQFHSEPQRQTFRLLARHWFNPAAAVPRQLRHDQELPQRTLASVGGAFVEHPQFALQVHEAG